MRLAREEADPRCAKDPLFASSSNHPDGPQLVHLDQRGADRLRLFLLRI